MSIRSTLRAVTVGFAALSLTAVGLTGCSSNADNASSDASSSSEGKTVELVVGASVTPHAKIVKYVADNLAEKEGLKITIREYQDYVQPNVALQSGDLDANFYQTIPFLKDQEKEKGYSFEHGGGIQIEPLGIYSEKVRSVEDVKDGAKVGIINDPTNQTRALNLLAANKLITLPKGKEVNVSQVESSATYNPHKLSFQQVEGPQLIRSLADVDIAVINGNFAEAGGKSPSDAIALESAENNPAVNVLVWKKGSAKTEAIKKLDKLLTSKEVADYIRTTWPDKAVIPAQS